MKHISQKFKLAHSLLVPLYLDLVEFKPGLVLQLCFLPHCYVGYSCQIYKLYQKTSEPDRQKITLLTLCFVINLFHCRVILHLHYVYAR